MRVVVAFALGFFLVSASAQEPVRLYAAGSLRAAMTELMQASGVP
jgi:hypothetical protein